MRKILGTLLIGLMLTVSGGIVRAGPLEDGIATYRSDDYATALRILPSLAEQGNAAAQFNLGSMYAHGQGVTLDYREAVKWYRQGAEQGNATAQVFLGLMYAQGQGVVQEYLRAHMWLNLAASKLSGNEGQGATEPQNDCETYDHRVGRACGGNGMAWQGNARREASRTATEKGSQTYAS